MAVLVDLGCSNKCTTGQVTYKWQKFISHSSAVLRYEDTSKFWWGFWWEPSSWFAVSQLLLVSSHSRKKTSWLWPFLIRALTSRMRAPPSWHNHSPKAQLLNIITLGLEFQPVGLWGYRQFIAMAPLFGFYDSAGETRQMCKFKIPLKTQQVLLHKSKQVPWGHRRSGRECYGNANGS